MRITILVDDPDSWFIPYAKKLQEELEKAGNQALLISDQSKAQKGELCFLLSCTKVVKKDFLKMHENNIVVHASDLPKGKGFAPLKRQILEGESRIVLTMFEAVEQVDAGPYYMKESMEFNGTELLDELQNVMAERIVSMCLKYVKNPDSYPPVQQQGEESFYPRFSEDDDRLDIHKTIAEQFDHFRIADNERFPLWFEYKGQKYYLKIYRDKKR